MSEDAPLSEDVVAMLNERRGGFNEAIGLSFVSATRDEVVAELTVGPQHLQPYGLVHGGVYAAIIETLASVGAALTAMPRGQTTLGLDNATSFLRGVRQGKLTGRARPIHRGRRTQVWEVAVTDEQGRTAAIGRLRTLHMEEGAAVAGKTVGFEKG